ncbi:MAG: hypothetical protein E7407_02160 [Ruminococcaceae bacterium]|nr:hypothetical protein [Oscillospiraceae bacterium]
MRHFIPKRNNLYKLPHNVYMQMLYLLRDYPRIKRVLKADEKNSDILRLSDTIICETISQMKEEYNKRSTTYGELEPYRAFFDYGYYSYMFARKTSELGASKSAWNLYRSKFAYHLAEKMGIL